MGNIKEKGYKTGTNRNIEYCITSSGNNKILHAYLPLSSLNRSLERMLKKNGPKIIINSTDMMECSFNGYGVVVSETINDK